MAILEKMVMVNLHPSNIMHYENKGYPIPRVKARNKLRVKNGSKIEVKIEDLPLGSHVQLTKICDYQYDNCSNYSLTKTKIPYSQILAGRGNNGGLDSCARCAKKNAGITRMFNPPLNKSLGERFPELISEWHEKNEKTPFEVFGGSNKSVLWQCTKNREHVYELSPSSRVYGGRGCTICSAHNRDTNEFIEELKAVHGAEFTVLGEYINRTAGILIRHNSAKCNNYEWSPSPITMLKGHGCPVCGGAIKKTNERFVVELDKLVGKEYTIMGLYNSSKDYIKMKHNICDYVWDVRPGNFLFGTRCPYCSSTKGEKAISDFLSKYNINFISQYRFEDCRNVKPLPFDFAIMDEFNDNPMLLIEYDGEPHYKVVSLFGGQEGFESRLKNDLIKTKYCEKNNIRLLRIPYWEYGNIANILKKELISLPLFETGGVKIVTEAI